MISSILSTNEISSSIPNTNEISSSINQKFYETNIVDSSIKVFSLSDIHGDIQSFIISLRDCAKVIKKKENFDYDNNKYDEDMENLLKLNLNDSEDIYVKDLNYEWCGENAHVVICGDIIDPNRNYGSCLKNNNMIKSSENLLIACAYYPQIELKILMFINAINIQAKKTNGKIVKLFGNHELCNIISNHQLDYNKYTYPIDRSNNYYKDHSRLDIFRVGQYGFNLLVEGGCGILIKINNTIFVHGDLVESYDYYDKLNQFINNPANRPQTKFELTFINKLYKDKYNKSIPPLTLIRNNYNFTFINKFYQDEWNKQFNNEIIFQNSSLMSRVRGNDKEASKRLIEKDTVQNSFCTDLINSFTKFKNDGKYITEDPNDLKLVIGHCVQHSASIIPLSQNITYETKISEDNVREVFGNNIYSGPPNFDPTDNRTKIFGITMECLIPDTKLNRIYRIDIGSSRGFDAFPNNKYPETIEKENQYLYSKTPQILEINIDGNINIIKSKMRNTRIHLPREDYEKFIKNKNLNELNIHANPIPHHYLKKYLKYKNKYFKLKKINFNI